ncbi:Cinnamoyl-CoA reductase-like SNL6 [Bienertia sinuspersici]
MPPTPSMATLKNDYHHHQTNKLSNKFKVCVMDASGSLGSSLVNTLLQRGYFVHAAIQSHFQDIEDIVLDEDTLHMVAVGEADYRWWCDDNVCGLGGNGGGGKGCIGWCLKILHADLLDYHSILDTLSGCSALFYSFEPPLEHPVYDEHMTEIEVRAAHNVLEACAQTPTMEKVIFTSSATAVVWTDTRNDSSLSCDADEKSWSDISFCKKFKLWHAMSKTLAEKTAWALAMDRGMSMVSINGGLLLDNSSNNLLNTSTTNNKQKTSNLPPYLKGAAEMYENGVLVAVDLKFLVDAHVCVFEEMASYGRYVCFNHVINCHKDAVKIAAMFISSPPQSLEDPREYPQRISNKKLNKLMVNFDGRFKLHS